ncbi:MAG: helix-turn-helix domain-containing protein [Variovorax sp.]
MNLDLDAQGFPARGGKPLDLPPKERAVLALLIRGWPRIVSKQEFADVAWGGRDMSDESLARCISRIRAAFADSPGPRIESVYGTGYRLDAGAGRSASHSRLSMAAQASPQAVEAFLHARLLAQQRTPAAMTRALALLRQIIEQHPRYAAARVAFAEAIGGAVGWALHADADLVQQGLRQLEEAERLDAGVFGLASARASLLDSAWRYDEAEAAWAEALPQMQGDPDSLFLHGRFLMLVGDNAGAVAQLRAAVQLHPYSALFRVTLARALAHGGESEAALAMAEATCEQHPESLIAVVHLSGLKALVRPDASIVPAARRAAQQADVPPIAQSTLAYVLVRTGFAAEARAMAESLLARSGTSPCEAVLYATIFGELGDPARALALLSAAEAARCGVLPMALREPASAALRRLPAVGQMAQRVFGRFAAGKPSPA